MYPISALGGAQYISAIKKPFSHVPMVASQGITIGNSDAGNCTLVLISPEYFPSFLHNFLREISIIMEWRYLLPLVFSFLTITCPAKHMYFLVYLDCQFVTCIENLPQYMILSIHYFFFFFSLESKPLLYFCY